MKKDSVSDQWADPTQELSTKIPWLGVKFPIDLS